MPLVGTRDPPKQPLTPPVLAEILSQHWGPSKVIPCQTQWIPSARLAFPQREFHPPGAGLTHQSACNNYNQAIWPAVPGSALLAISQQTQPSENRRTHRAHTGDTLGAPGYGDQGRPHYWATQDTFYTKPLLQDQETHMIHLIHKANTES